MSKGTLFLLGTFGVAGLLSLLKKKGVSSPPAPSTPPSTPPEEIPRTQELLSCPFDSTHGLFESLDALKAHIIDVHPDKIISIRW